MLPDWALPKVDNMSIPLPVNRARKVVRRTPTLTGLQRFENNFFGLPPEIRNMVYKFIYVGPENVGYDTTHKYHGRFPHHQICDFLDFGYALNSRLIQDEASSVYNTQNTFEFYRLGAIVPFTRHPRIRPENIISIKLNYQDGEPLRTFRFIKNHLPSLKKLEIWLHYFIYFGKGEHSCYACPLEKAWEFFFTDYEGIRFGPVVDFGNYNVEPIPRRARKVLGYRTLKDGLKEFKLAQTPKKKRDALREAVRLSMNAAYPSSVMLSLFAVETLQRSS